MPAPKITTYCIVFFSGNDLAILCKKSGRCTLQCRTFLWTFTYV